MWSLPAGAVWRPVTSHRRAFLTACTQVLSDCSIESFTIWSKNTVETNLTTADVQTNPKICCERTLVGSLPGLSRWPTSGLSRWWTPGWPPRRTCSGLPEWVRGLAPEQAACGSVGGCRLKASCSSSRCLWVIYGVHIMEVWKIGVKVFTCRSHWLTLGALLSVPRWHPATNWIELKGFLFSGNGNWELRPH